MMEKFEHQEGADALSEVLEVSESGFAAKRGKPHGQRWKEDAELRVLIARSFAESRNSYGSPRARADLRFIHADLRRSMSSRPAKAGFTKVAFGLGKCASAQGWSNRGFESAPPPPLATLTGFAKIA
jgi:hypothetical protein